MQLYDVPSTQENKPIKDTFEAQEKANLLNQLGRTKIKRLELSKYTANILVRAGILTIADLILLSPRELFFINGLGAKRLAEIQNALDQALNSPASYLEAPPGAHQKSYLKTWSEIIEPFLRSEKEMHIYVLISRFGSNNKALAELATELQLSRERVRQIGKRAADRLLRQTGFPDSRRTLDRIIEILFESKEDLSLESFKSILTRKRLLGKFSEPIKSDLYDPDPFELLIIWLDLLSDSRVTDPPRVFPVEIDDLRKVISSSISDYKALQTMPHDKIKELLRKVAYTGGIHLRDAMKILSSGEHATLVELKSLNLCEIRDRWFSVGSFTSGRKILPLILAGNKMLSAVEEMEFSSFYHGLSRYAQRFFDPIAPQDVVLHYIKLAGFEVKLNRVSNPAKVEDALSKTELCFIDAIRTNGNVASFREIVQAFRHNGFSKAAVVALVQYSPISERVDTALYKIRGSDVPQSAVEAARIR